MSNLNSLIPTLPPTKDQPFLALVDDFNDLEQLLKDLKPTAGILALDTETNSLDTVKAQMAGFSFCVSPWQGYYVPTGHKIGTNIDKWKGWGLIQSYKERHSLLEVYFNAKYDVSVLEVNVAHHPKVYEDVMNQTHLDDPDREEKGLKPLAKKELGFAMEKFEDLFTADEIKARSFDISVKLPKRCFSYAASDAVATFMLYEKFRSVNTEFKFPYTVDTKLVEEIRCIEQYGGMEINSEYINHQTRALTARAEVFRDMIWRAAGTEFEIASAKQLGDILFGRLGLPSPGQTAGGQHKTGKEELGKLAEEFPIAEWVICYRKLVKARDSYFKKLLTLADMGVKPRFSFNMFAAPTFRLAAPGGDPNKDGKTGVNIQAVSNGEARLLMGVVLDLEESTSTPKASYINDLDDDDLLFAEPTKSASIITSSKSSDIDWALDATGKNFKDGVLETLPWILQDEDGRDICIRDGCNNCGLPCDHLGIDVIRRPVKGVEVIPSVRQAFKAPKGYILMGCDYDRQEVVIAANLSKEPKWVNALLKKEDLHGQTACAAFGLATLDNLSPAEKKKKRGVGKMLNFATLYGATAHTLARNSGLPLAVAEQVYDAFTRRHPQLFAWMDRVKLFARRNGYTTTYFGRRRWLKQFYDTNSNSMKGFADRSAVNTAIQGCLPSGVRVQTKDGWLRIETLVGKRFEVWTGFKWAWATGVDKGLARLAEVEYETGEVTRCDTRHKMKSVGGLWTEFKDWVPGDLHAMPVLQPRLGLQQKGWFYFLGRIMGDGNLMDKGPKGVELQVVYGPDEGVEAERQVKWLQSQGFDVSYRVKDRTNESRRVNFIISKQNGALSEKLIAMGMIPGAVSTTKHIPESVWSASLSQQQEFLQGMIDSDGSKTNLDVHSRIHLANQDLVRELYILAYGLGFDGVVKKTRTGFYLDIRKGNTRSYPSKAVPAGLVTTSRGDIEAIVCRAIQKGDREGCTQEIAEGFMNRFYPSEEVYRYARVKEVRVLDREETTYTLSVEDDLHQFVADGFIHKNTGADVTRIAMVKCGSWLEKNQVDREEARMVMSVHDEILFQIREDLVPKVAPAMVDCMQFNVKGWAVQLSVGPKVGTVWGKLKEVDIKDIS